MDIKAFLVLLLVPLLGCVECQRANECAADLDYDNRCGLYDAASSTVTGCVWPAKESQFAEWADAPKSEIIEAERAAWRYARYHLADRREIDGLGFPAFRSNQFQVHGKISTSLSMRHFPFIVASEEEHHSLHCILVTFNDEKDGFEFAVYVNVNNGAVGLDFGKVCGSKMSITGQSRFPFLRKCEIEKQKRLIGAKR